MPSEEVEVQKRRTRDRHIDVLLMAIIRANPHHNRDSVPSRLQAAREALLGEKPRSGNPPIFDDVELFHIVAEMRKKHESNWMAHALLHLQSDEGRAALQAEIERSPDSIRKAARKRARALLGADHNQEEGVVDRLRHKAPKARRAFTSQDMAELEGLANGDSPRVTMVRNAIEALIALGIETADPWSE